MELFSLPQVLFISCIVLCSWGSLYNPHMFPESGPFFEGWYIRFTDAKNARSFGVLFGKVLPEDRRTASKLLFMGLIYDDEDTSRLLHYNAFPDGSLLNLTVKNGHLITHNPNVAPPAEFRWDAGHYGYINVTPKATYIDITVERVHFEAHIGTSIPWDMKHEGPQGWLHRLPFTPLFWFVYSTSSPIVSYMWHHLDSREVITGTTGVVHMEKNWGKSFPPAWVWTQGVRADGVLYAIAFGPVSFGPLTLSGYLGGYRNPGKSIDISFRPDNAHMSQTLNPCSGDILITIRKWSYKLVFHVSADLGSFSCLFGPMSNGFRKVCIESFKAIAEVKVYKRNWFQMELIDYQSIPLSALEFGGTFMCKGECS